MTIGAPALLQSGRRLQQVIIRKVIGKPIFMFRLDLAEKVGAELNFAIAAQAVPSGLVEDTVLELVASEICNAVEAGCDGLFLDLHGGMVTKGYDDPEGELLRRIRAVAPDLPIAVAFDFHTNMSQATAEWSVLTPGSPASAWR